MMILFLTLPQEGCGGQELPQHGQVGSREAEKSTQCIQCTQWTHCTQRAQLYTSSQTPPPPPPSHRVWWKHVAYPNLAYHLLYTSTQVPKYLDGFAMLAKDVPPDAGSGHCILVLREGSGQFKQKTNPIFFYLLDHNRCYVKLSDFT